MSHLSPYPVAPPSCPLVARVASVALLCYTAFLSSRRAGWLLLVALSPYRLALPSHPPVAPDGCCLSRRLCCHIMLRRPLALSSCRLIVACRVVALSSRAARSSSHRAGWLLFVTSPLSPYCLGPPSLASCALSYCAALSSSCRLCRPIMLRRQPQHTNTTPTTNNMSHCHLTVQIHCLLHNG
jgi:hypothetical protein